MDASGSFVVDMKWKGGKLTDAWIHSKNRKECALRYEEKKVSLKTMKGKSYLFDSDMTLTAVYATKKKNVM
jgi:alpha-L-fucosidase 2